MKQTDLIDIFGGTDMPHITKISSNKPWTREEWMEAMESMTAAIQKASEILIKIKEEVDKTQKQA